MLRWDGTVLLVAFALLGAFTHPSAALPTVKKIGTTTTSIPTTVSTNTSGTPSATQQADDIPSNRFATINSGIMSKMIKTNSLNINNYKNNTNNISGGAPKPENNSDNADDINALSDRISELDTNINKKQDALTPGDGIKIENNTISLSDEMAGLPEKVDDISQEMATLNDRVDIATGTDSGAFSTLQNNVTNLQNDVAELKDTVGDTSMATTAQTVTAAITELKDAINNLKVARNAYAAGIGMVVKPGATDNDPPTIGLDLPENSIAGASYVFQPNNNGGGTWTPLEVQDNWNPGF